MTSFPITIPFGVLTLDAKKTVSSFREKPVLKEVMNIGYYYVPSIFIKSIHKHKNFVKFIESIIKKKALKCYEHNKLHITIIKQSIDIKILITGSLQINPINLKNLKLLFLILKTVN